MATLMKRIEDAEEINDPGVVKVVVNKHNFALYFSRVAIPFHARNSTVKSPAYYKHIGLYVYRRNFLLRYSDLPVGPLERAEKLEQLRALESGFQIRVVETDYESFGVDTPEDLERVRHLVRAGNSAVRSEVANG